MNAPNPVTGVAIPRVLFVGAFAPMPGTAIRGGQLAACRAILSSPLSEHVDWVLLDSMMESIPPPPLARRALLAGRRLVQFIRHMVTSRIDVVLIFTSSEMSLVEKGAMAILAKVAGKRVVLCPRSGYIVREWRERRTMRWWLRTVVGFTDAIVCQGRRWREFFCAISGRPVERFPVVYNIAASADGTVAPLPPRDTAGCVLLMGWVERNKGVFDLVDVVEQFRIEFQGMRFVICGNGPDFAELELEIDRRGLADRFELRGWVDEAGKTTALSEADICLMLSHREGMPNSLIEYMAAGRPVIATAVGAVADIVEPGRTGFLCEPGDVTEIGFRLCELQGNRALREALGSAGQAAIVAKMSREVVWRRWLEVLVPDHAALGRTGESAAKN